MSSRVNRRTFIGRLLGLGTAVFAGGCGPDYKARGTVKGVVTTGSKHLTTGTVVFYGKDNMTGSATIDSEGKYELGDAPLGDCRVTVTVNNSPFDASVRARMQGKGNGPKLPDGPKPPPGVERPGGGEPPPGAKVPKEVVPVDQKYSNVETSGLTFTVKKGEQTYSIEL